MIENNKNKISKLVADAHLYVGKWVATKSFDDRKVICSGKDPVETYNEAVALGIDHPVIMFIPRYYLCPSVWHIKKGEQNDE